MKMNKHKIHPVLAREECSLEDLLDIRMCDLGLQIKGTPLETLVNKFFDELKDKGFVSLPTCYLGDEWFSPDGVPAIAIPFYLAHPKLHQLEQKMMLEVEGSSDKECLKLLRHECGHAIIHAFNLTRRPTWRKIFGDADSPFEDYYRFMPYSRSYVQHLKNWYAQSHPEEDFAETFAVWLGNQNWKDFYASWPAIKKLEYVDKLMQDVMGKPFTARKSHLLSHVDRLKRTLKSHYEKRKKLYAQDEEEYFDNDLIQIFTKQEIDSTHRKADEFLRKNRRIIMNSVAKWTHERKFVIRQLLSKLIRRCQKLSLTRNTDDDTVLIHFIAYLTAITSHHRYTSRYKGRK